MSQMDGRSTFALTPWVRRLIAANAVVYLLTITVFTGTWFSQAFAFAPSAALTQPWTFVTYAFVHGGFLHLAFNMLMLFFFGPAVEERLGGRGVIGYYLFCGLGGAALSFAIALLAPVAPFVGASGAVLGVALAFALYWPDAAPLGGLLFGFLYLRGATLAARVPRSSPQRRTRARARTGQSGAEGGRRREGRRRAASRPRPTLQGRTERPLP